MNRIYPNTDVALRCAAAAPEAQALILLSVQAVLRRDHRLMTGLVAFRHMGEPGAKSQSNAGAAVPALDATLNRLRAVCPEDDAEDWGRLLALTLLGRDQARLDTLLALTGQRCAN